MYDKFDGLNEGSRAKLDMTKTVAKGEVLAGATSIEVENSAGFKVGQEVTIYDNVNNERPIINEVRLVDNSVTNDVVDATVINKSYDTSGNGGRKLVRLDNGWLVAVVLEGDYKLNLYKSVDNGLTWSIICNWQRTSSGLSVTGSLATFNNIVYLITNDDEGTHFSIINPVIQNNVNIWSLRTIIVSSGNGNSKGMTSLAVNKEGTELHACWSGKNATFTNSFNIYYAKGTINGDGTVS